MVAGDVEHEHGRQRDQPEREDRHGDRHEPGRTTWGGHAVEGNGPIRGVGPKRRVFGAFTR
jgi:hypothetical protein